MLVHGIGNGLKMVKLNPFPLKIVNNSCADEVGHDASQCYLMNYMFTIHFSTKLLGQTYKVLYLEY